jgi:hypothetical protein
MCVAKARSTIVLIDKETRRSVPLPPGMIQQIRFLFSEDNEAETRKSGFAWFDRNDRSGDQ